MIKVFTLVLYFLLSHCLLTVPYAGVSPRRISLEYSLPASLFYWEDPLFSLLFMQADTVGGQTPTVSACLFNLSPLDSSTALSLSSLPHARILSRLQCFPVDHHYSSPSSYLSRLRLLASSCEVSSPKYFHFPPRPLVSL